MTSNRRRFAAAAALVAIGAGFWALRSGSPPLPDLVPTARDGLVFLDGPRSGVDAMNVGLPGTMAPPPAAPLVDPWAALIDPATAPVIGPAADGVPTVVALFDYRCPFCRAHAPDLWERALAGEIRLLLRDWAILGPPSVLAAEAALAAWQQGAYLELHQGLMTTGFVPTEGLVRDLAGRNGLDLAAFDAARSGREVAARLAHNATLAAALGVPGVPVYAIDRVVIAGGYDPGQLLALARHHAPGV